MVPRARDTLLPRTGFRGAFHTRLSGETLIVRCSGERPVYAGRFNMESVSRSARGAPTSGPTGSAQPEKHVDVRTFGVQCISPNIVGCSQRSRQVVEQKHTKPCLTSPVSVTR